MQKFSWKDRDSAAYDMLQLVYHGPEHIRLCALQAIQAIRSSNSIAELKAIALHERWPFHERSEALEALAAFPDDIFIPELAPMLKAYWEERWRNVQSTLHISPDSVTQDLLYPEQGFYSAILTTISANPSNQPWFFELLLEIDPTARIELLSNAIGAACQSPLEPMLMNLLTGLLDDYPALFTIDTAEVVANHGNDQSDQWLIQQADKIIALSASVDTTLLYNLFSFSPGLATAVAEKNPALARLNPHSPDNNYTPQIPEGVTSEPTVWKPNFDFRTTPIGQQIEQLYSLAASGDEAAFTSLCVLSDDYRVSIPVQAVITHFLGKLWPHKRVLEQLCMLVQNDQVWEKTQHDSPPVRLEAAEALCNTATPMAWEALVNVLFLSEKRNSPYIDWLTDLTDGLSNVPSTRKPVNWHVSLPGSFRKISDNKPATRKDWTWTVEDRPWFQFLGDVTDDLDAILADQ